MSIILDLEPEIEPGLPALAEAKGLSLAGYVHEIRESEFGAGASAEPDPACIGPLAGSLFEMFAPVPGLLTDDEANRSFSRRQIGAPIESLPDASSRRRRDQTEKPGK